MKINIYVFKTFIGTGAFIPRHLGYIEMEEFDAEKCFHICNWTNWTKKKPIELHADIKSCGHGVCFENPITKEKWLAKSFGWVIGDSAEITNYAIAHRNNPIWL